MRYWIQCVCPEYDGRSVHHLCVADRMKVVRLFRCYLRDLHESEIMQPESFLNFHQLRKRLPKFPECFFASDVKPLSEDDVMLLINEFLPHAKAGEKEEEDPTGALMAFIVIRGFVRRRLHEIRLLKRLTHGQWLRIIACPYLKGVRESIPALVPEEQRLIVFDTDFWRRVVKSGETFLVDMLRKFIAEEEDIEDHCRNPRVLTNGRETEASFYPFSPLSVIPLPLRVLFGVRGQVRLVSHVYTEDWWRTNRIEEREDAGDFVCFLEDLNELDLLAKLKETKMDDAEFSAALAADFHDNLVSAFPSPVLSSEKPAGLPSPLKLCEMHHVTCGTLA